MHRMASPARMLPAALKVPEGGGGGLCWDLPGGKYSTPP